MTLQFFNKIFNLGGTSTAPLDFGGFKLGATAVKKVLEFFGYPLNLTNIPTATTLAGYKVYGNTEQDGTPTPDNPIEVQSVGEKTKNLLDIPAFNSDKNLSLTGSIKLKANTNYTISLINENGSTTGIRIGSTYVCNLRQGTTTIARFASNTSTIQLTEEQANQIDNYIIYYAPAQYSGTSATLRIQLEEGSTATTYEPYGYKVPIKVDGTTTNIYLSEPLRKLGDYADYIDFENQEVVRNIKEEKLNSNMSMQTYALTKIRMFLINYAKSIPNFVGLKSNRFQSSTQSSWGGANGNEVVIQGGQVTPSVCLTFPADTEINTVELFKQWVDENETLVYYPIQTSTTEKITLPDIAISKGDSVITTDTEIKPSDMYGKVIV